MAASTIAGPKIRLSLADPGYALVPWNATSVHPRSGAPPLEIGINPDGTPILPTLPPGTTNTPSLAEQIAALLAAQQAGGGTPRVLQAVPQSNTVLYIALVGAGILGWYLLRKKHNAE